MRKFNQGNTRYFQKIDSNLKAYFLGFIAADGCIQYFDKNCIGLSITLNIKDKIILDKLKSEIGNEHEIRVWSRKQTFNPSVLSTFCRFQLANKQLAEDIKQYGIDEKKSLTIGNIVPNIPKQYRKAFILGYFDGDGCVMEQKGRIKWNKTKEIFYQVNSNVLVINIRGTKDFLFGIATELKLENYALKKYDSTYRLVIAKKSEVKKFFTVYENQSFFLERKYNKFLNRINKG